MAGRDVNRAFYIKRLLEKLEAQSDDKLEPEQRRAAAERALDVEVGADWRAELKQPGVAVTKIVTKNIPSKLTDKPEELFDRIRACGMKHGLGYKDADYDQSLDQTRKPSHGLREQVVAMFDAFLRKLL